MWGLGTPFPSKRSMSFISIPRWKGKILKWGCPLFGRVGSSMCLSHMRWLPKKKLWMWGRIRSNTTWEELTKAKFKWKSWVVEETNCKRRLVARRMWDMLERDQVWPPNGARKVVPMSGMIYRFFTYCKSLCWLPCSSPTRECQCHSHLSSYPSSGCLDGCKALQGLSLLH